MKKISTALAGLAVALPALLALLDVPVEPSVGSGDASVSAGQVGWAALDPIQAMRR